MRIAARPGFGPVPRSGGATIPAEGTLICQLKCSAAGFCRHRLHIHEVFPREGDMYVSVARFCVRHRRWILLAWVILFVAGMVIGSQVFSRLKDTHGGSGSESVQGEAIMTRASSMGPSALVLIK